MAKLGSARWQASVFLQVSIGDEFDILACGEVTQGRATQDFGIDRAWDGQRRVSHELSVNVARMQHEDVCRGPLCQCVRREHLVKLSPDR